MTKSNNWERVYHAWMKAIGLDEGSVDKAAFEAAWRYSRMTWRDTKYELETEIIE